MRGLTPLERAYLSIPAGTYVPGGPLWDAAGGMIECGRVRQFVDSANGFTARRKTDLGALALRVCPVDENA